MKKKFLVVSCAALLILLAACGQAGTATETASPTEPPAAPTLDQAALDAAVAATVAAELTRIAVENPSPTPAPTNTPEPTDPPTAVPSPTATVGAEALENHALFLADVTIPDGTQIVADTPFTKTWRLQNIGFNTWTTDFTVVFVNGDRMEGAPINLPVGVPPGGTVDITIAMVAPSEAGAYEGYWMLADADGNVFGLGEAADQAFLVSIVVLPAPTATPTLAPTETPAPTATP
jgi:hypothetical protein